MVKECNIEENLERCTCTYTSCGKRGRCCECLHYHWKNGELPGCLFPPELEKTYDRSLRAFIEYYKNRI
nr:DUF6485 family protein [Candidatus Freyarchaeota archaeon]